MEKYTIISDSSCDLKSKDLTDENITFVTVPIFYTLEGTEYPDDENVNIKELLEKMKQTKLPPKTACATPESFAEQMRAAQGHVICVTLSSKISATYSNACIAANTVHAETPDKKIFVIDSLSAIAGIARILYKLVGLIQSGKYTFDEVTQRITEIRSKNKIRFLLNDLSNLVKSGRMSKIAGIITSIIPLKLVLGDNGEGEIKKYKQVIGFKKGIEALSEFTGEHKDDPNNLIVISHCNNEEDANTLKRFLETKFAFRNVKTLSMRGIGTFLANDKGLAVAY